MVARQKLKIGTRGIVQGKNHKNEICVFLGRHRVYVMRRIAAVMSVSGAAASASRALFTRGSCSDTGRGNHLRPVPEPGKNQLLGYQRARGDGSQ